MALRTSWLNLLLVSVPVQCALEVVSVSVCLSRGYRWCFWLVRETYILFNLLCAPPAIFCVRNATSSCFCSSNCFFNSSLFLPQSCEARILLDDWERPLALCIPPVQCHQIGEHTIVGECAGECRGRKGGMMSSLSCLDREVLRYRFVGAESWQCRKPEDGKPLTSAPSGCLRTERADVRDPIRHLSEAAPHTKRLKRSRERESKWRVKEAGLKCDSKQEPRRHR